MKRFFDLFCGYLKNLLVKIMMMVLKFFLIKFIGMWDVEVLNFYGIGVDNCY